MYKLLLFEDLIINNSIVDCTTKIFKNDGYKVFDNI